MKSPVKTSKKKTIRRNQGKADASSNAKEKNKTLSFREKGVDGTARTDSKVYKNRIDYERMLGQEAWDLTPYHGPDWNCIETLLFGPETSNPEEGFSSADGLLAKGRPEWVKFVHKLILVKIEFRKQVECALENNLHPERLISLDGPAIGQLFILDHSIFGDRPEGLDKLVFKQVSFLKWFQVLHPALVPGGLISTITPIEERVRLLKKMRADFHHWVATGEYPKDDDLSGRITLTGRELNGEGAPLAGLHEDVGEKTGKLKVGGVTLDGIPVQEPSKNSFIYAGDFWSIEYNGERLAPVKDLDGMGYIAFLLERPHERVSPLELRNAVKGTATEDVGDMVMGKNEKESRDKGATYGGEPVIDDTAIKAIKAEIGSLEDELKFPDTGKERREELEGKIKELQCYLGSSTDNRGKGRRFPDENEKARQTIIQRISSAIKNISTHHKLLGEHLRANITGCAYNPETNSSIKWDVSR